MAFLAFLSEWWENFGRSRLCSAPDTVSQKLNFSGFVVTAAVESPALRTDGGLFQI